MSKREERPILVSELRYVVEKLILSDGIEVARPFGTQIVRSTSKGRFYMQAGGKASSSQNLKVGEIERICYSVTHVPTKTVSPIYDHPFESDPLHHMDDGLLYVGPMKLFPAEQVWPELTRKGYYGELPQFFT